MVFSGYSDFLHDITEIPVLLKVALSTITLNLLYLSNQATTVPKDTRTLPLSSEDPSEV
jgi:hypothetical protein